MNLMQNTEAAPAADAIETPIEGEGWRFLRSRRWVGYFAMLLVFSVVCVLLGNWQFARRAEARAEINRIDQNYDASAVPLAEALPDPASYDEDANKWLTVEATGHYLDEYYLARNRPNQERVGTNLIVPFETEDGVIFFIDRGWLEPGDDPQTPLFVPSVPEGTVTVEARLRGTEPQTDGQTAGRTVSSIYLPELARLVGEPSYTGAFGLLVAETPDAEHGILPTRPERDEGPHLSYALQWYVFIIIAGIGVWYAARQEYRTLNAGSDEVIRDEERMAERKRRRGPSDADEEDALLDG